MKPLISALTLAMGTSIATQAAAEDRVCMPTTEMKASQNTGTWTMIKTFGDGSACVLAQGEDWTLNQGQDALLARLDR